ncbi:ribosomal protein S5 domain 2-type protein [Endogone sp. FLAS-F59071]|nr:ribosomal protein S5 domain 2-type protein [Endogone sp. FLAS-F59071]|eukprot:RUS15435.1 ribosomal protein S5 domain 2-type protein [Endogone sp. FLAS-F59071]
MLSSITARRAHTLVSAPGKVLLTGGYLVLDRTYEGLVVGTDARFYTYIQDGGHAPTESKKKIVVRSLQFEQGMWEYDIEIKNEKVLLEVIPTGSTNKFVETCVCFCLSIILEMIGTEKLLEKIATGLDINIAGNNDFYSQREQLSEPQLLRFSVSPAKLRSRSLPITIASLRVIPPFCHTGSTLGNVHKTGLGSSAALITSLVAALFLHTSAVPALDGHADRALVHNVAQFVHCFAQGKVGSGFDVSAAVWGSHRYRRFDPKVLDSIMDDDVNPALLFETVSPKNPAWNNVVTPFKLPPHLTLILADIDAGSHTPSLVTNALWTELGIANTELERTLRELSKLHEEDDYAYEDAVAKLISLMPTTIALHPIFPLLIQWLSLSASHTTSAPLRALATAASTFESIRSLIRRMSAFSDVPVEPEEQTRLLDACLAVPGVVMAGVPGAGGYDAIFCIVLSADAAREVERVWQSWTEMSVGPLLAQEDFVGARVEKVEDVAGFNNVI